MVLDYLPTDDQVPSLIGKVYDAALDQHLWERFLDTLAPVFHSDLGTAVFENHENPDSTVALTYGFDEALQAQWLERRDAEDYFWHGIRKQRAGTVFTGMEFIPPDEMHQRPVYHELAKPLGVEYMLAAVVDRQRGSASVISFLRSDKSENFGARSRQLLALLLPHIQRAWQMNRRLALTEAESNSALSALEHSSHGVLILDRTGHASFVNRNAEAMLLAGDGLTLRYGRLKFYNYSTQLQFDGILRQALEISRLEGMDLENGLRVPRPSGQASYQVVLCPLNRRSDEVLLNEQGACLVFIHDPAEPREISVEILQSTYGLTHAEARLCRALFETGSLSAARDSLAISLNTGKTHLKNIFAKLGVSSQAQLMQTLALGLRVM